MGKTRKDRRDRDFFNKYDDGGRGGRGDRIREPPQRDWKRFENSSLKDVEGNYDPDDDMVDDD